MTIAPLYQCPKCKETSVAQTPLGVINGGVLTKAYIQHVCRNPDCNHRDLAPAEARFQEDAPS